KRKKNAGDTAASSNAEKTRADRGAAAQARRVTIGRRDAERAAASLERIEMEKELGGSVFARYTPCPGPVVLSLDEGPVLAGGRRVLDAPSLAVPRDGRIHVVGPNGAGKSTLLAALLERAKVAPGRLLRLPQELSPEEARGSLDTARSL